jgi:NADH:ubiquinone oxidoreductase subunit 3 (subunit A)
VVFLVLWALVFDNSMSYVALASVALFVLLVGVAVGVSLQKEKEVLI